MSFLFRNAYFFQDVQNGFTLDFKLSGQIIDSNFHPFSRFLQDFPLRDHIDLTALFLYNAYSCLLRFFFTSSGGRSVLIRRARLHVIRLT